MHNMEAEKQRIKTKSKWFLTEMFIVEILFKNVIKYTAENDIVYQDLKRRKY